MSGRLLLQDPDGLVEAISYFNIVNDHLAQLYGLSVPYIQIVVGAMLALGFLTNLVAIIAILLLSSF
ncbi:MAG: MauE/DoxX family redox-associated membrane protein, partial [Candidatus Paceibacterota bacterium]